MKEETMAKGKVKICFIGDLSLSFVKRDYEILEKHFDVDVVQPPKRRNLSWLKYIFVLARSVFQSDLTFSWFAGWHSAFAIFLSKLFRKKSIVVAGGYDCASVPEIDYGAFSKGRILKEGLPARFSLSHADIVLPVSNFTESEILKRVKTKRMDVIYNGIDIENFRPIKGKENLCKENSLAITVGGVNWSNLKRKGIETFVRSAKFAPKAHFVVIGKPRDDSIDYLKSIAPSNVEFTGFVSDEDLIKWYQKAKVICQLSYYEAFGLAPAEGMACGCIPVVTKKRVGLPEIVGDTGFYVPYGDPKATAEAIEKALKVDDARGKRARQRIKDMFAMERREREIIKIVENG